MTCFGGGKDVEGTFIQQPMAVSDLIKMSITNKSMLSG
jgi:hypothetical protein